MKTNSKYHLAFSLLEILIVLALVAILAIFSFHSWQHHLTKTRRQHAKIALMALAQQMEHYYLQHHSYQGASFENLHINPHLTQYFYRLAIEQKDSGHFLISATPYGIQKKNSFCGVLRLNHLGARSVSGEGDVETCWQ